MEVKETAACGISLREFAVEFDADEIVDMFRVLNYAQSGVGSYDEDFLDDLKSQMAYIIGPSVEEEPRGERGRGVGEELEKRRLMVTHERINLVTLLQLDDRLDDLS